jgi:hypothetical protein
MVTFPRAPLRSRTVGFPESGSDLGCPPQGLPTRGEAQALARIHPGPSWFAARARRRFEDPRVPARCPGAVLRPPSAQSPFARLGCYLRRGGVPHHLQERYPLFLAPTGSCARPNPSPLLRSSLGREVFAGCCQTPAGRWPFPTFSVDLSRDAWACAPAARVVPVPVASHATSAFPIPSRWVGACDSPLETASCGFDFRGRCHSFLLQASRFAHHSGCPHPCDPRRAAVASPSGQNPRRCLRGHRIC